MLYNPYNNSRPSGNLFTIAFWCCREHDLKGALQGLGDTVLQQVTEALNGLGGGPPPRESLNLLKGQISELWKANNPVRTLIGQTEHKKPKSIKWSINEGEILKNIGVIKRVILND